MLYFNRIRILRPRKHVMPHYFKINSYMLRILLFCICCSLIIMSCGDSASTAQKELLVGSWVFENGTRDGSVEGTELLQNLVFDFTDSTFRCELLPEMQEGFTKEAAYDLSSGNLSIGGKLNMELKDITQDNLLLKFQLNLGGEPTEFDLKFKRKS